jgi:hypothetical protein
LFNVSTSTLGDKFYSFNGVTDSWVQEASSTVMEVGLYYPGGPTYAAPNPPSFYQATFIGVPIMELLVSQLLPLEKPPTY